MKTLITIKYADVVVQTILIGVALYGFATTILTPRWPQELWLVQMILGPWQLMSAIISLLAKGRWFRQKATYLGTAFLYLVILFGSEVQLWVWIWFAPAWTLALYYYFLTWKTLIPERKSGGHFLPHLGF